MVPIASQVKLIIDSPYIAVGTPSKVMLFYQYKPYYRHLMTAEPINTEEESAWRSMKEQTISASDGLKLLLKLKDDLHCKLTPLSYKFITSNSKDRQ